MKLFLLGLLVFPAIFIFLIIRKKDWKYPIKDRPVQFTFAIITSILSMLYVFSLPFLVFISLFSEGIILNMYMTIGAVFSFVSLFRPRASIAVVVIALGIPLVAKLEKSEDIKKGAWVDVCNELRVDPNCKEEAEQFVCAEKSFSKDICINKQGNDQYKFKELPHAFIGKEIKTIAPAILEYNLPRNNCMNRFCGYIAEASLDDTYSLCNKSINRSRDEITTPLRTKLVALGTEFKILNYYKVSRRSRAYSPAGPSYYFLLEDGHGKKVELSDHDLKYLFENNRNYSGDSSCLKSLAEGVAQIETNGFFGFKVPYRLNLSTNRVKIEDFIRDLNFTSDDIEYEVDTKNDKKFILIKVKNEIALTTLFQYQKTWEIGARLGD